ncbi:MAG TPA: ribonuclease HIII [Candidatus Acidoferrum sp.]|nr:ribonuclease HIII [Candidatus Acidoferrum sp.]
MVNSILLSQQELTRLQIIAKEQRLNLRQPTNQYEVMRVFDHNIQLILYSSGKVVHNDSPEGLRLLRQCLAPVSGMDYVGGSDEAGKGEWYGPLVVACAALTPQQYDDVRIFGVHDSKQLDATRLKCLASQLVKVAVYDLVTLLPEDYNRQYSSLRSEGKSLNDLLAKAHATAINNVLAKLDKGRIRIFIDQFDERKTNSEIASILSSNPNLEILQFSKDTETSISVASILAKSEFESQVDRLEAKYGVTLRKSAPENLSREVLPYVAKTHFRNVAAVLT